MAAEPIRVTYQVMADAATIEARAHAIAIEQSIEVAPDIVDDTFVRDEIVGRVVDIRDAGDGRFDVTIDLAAATAPAEPGQLLNMLFGNTSLQPDVVLADVVLPNAHLAEFGGPRVGLAGLRSLCGAQGRALTATALKPQGLPADGLAAVARDAALGGVDIVKDDHGMADQAYAPFADRVVACARAVAAANRSSGGRTVYAPALSGGLDTLRRQMRLLGDEGVQAALVSPMLTGLPAFHAIAKEHPGIALLAHPSFGGAARIAPDLLFGHLFRVLGADAVIFPNHGGRFTYSPQTCRAIAHRCCEPLGEGLLPAVPMPAGGMTLSRVPEMLSFYGRDVALLIGGALLAARENLRSEAAAFAAAVAEAAERSDV
jgi:ribulose-bisphosphate carboxylase large chain